MNSKNLSAIYSRFVLALVAVVALVQVAAAQEHGMHSYPELSFTVLDDALEGPDSVEAGLYTLDIANESAFELVEPTIGRIKEGVSEAQVLEAVEALLQSFMTGEGEGEATAQVMDAVTVVGGTTFPEGGVFELEPGEYIALSTGTTDEGQSHISLGLYKTFTVTEAPQIADAPPVDLTVNMLDFAFTIPDEVRAGEQVWEIQNVGEQLHHLVLVKIREGKTMEDVMTFIQTEEGEPPVDEAGYVDIISPGVHNYLTFDLKPGSYVALCFITDPATGQPHVALGMIDAFTVVGQEGAETGGETGGEIGGDVTGGGEMSAGQPEDTFTLSGTIQNWEGGAATLEAVSTNNEGDVLGTFATGEVAEDGSFMLELPAEVPQELLYEDSTASICSTGEVVADPEPFQNASLFELNLSRDGEAIGTAVLASSLEGLESGGTNEGDYAISHIYSPSDLSIQGSCTQEGLTSNVTIAVRPGWNRVAITTTAVSPEGEPTGVEFRSVSEIPGEANWYFLPATDESATGGDVTGGSETGGSN